MTTPSGIGYLFRIPNTPMFSKPFQSIKLSILKGDLASILNIKGTSILMQPIHDLQMASRNGITKGGLIQRTSFLFQPLQQSKMSSHSGHVRSQRIQGTSFFLQPLHDIHPATFRNLGCGVFIDWTSILVCPLQHLKMLILSSMGTSVLSQSQPFPLNHFNTSRCPPPAAIAHVDASNRHPFSTAHFNTSR